MSASHASRTWVHRSQDRSNRPQRKTPPQDGGADTEHGVTSCVLKEKHHRGRQRKSQHNMLQPMSHDKSLVYSQGCQKIRATSAMVPETNSWYPQSPSRAEVLRGIFHLKIYEQDRHHRILISPFPRRMLVPPTSYVDEIKLRHQRRLLPMHTDKTTADTITYRRSAIIYCRKQLGKTTLLLLYFIFLALSHNIAYKTFRCKPNVLP